MCQSGNWRFLCCDDFDPFFQIVSRQDLVPLTLCFGGEGLQVYIDWGVPPADGSFNGC
jgi:hypothetical protein